MLCKSAQRDEFIEICLQWLCEGSDAADDDSIVMSRYCDFLYGILVEDASVLVKALPSINASPDAKTKARSPQAGAGSKDKSKKPLRSGAAKKDGQPSAALAYLSEVRWHYSPD